MKNHKCEQEWVNLQNSISFILILNENLIRKRGKFKFCYFIFFLIFELKFFINVYLLYLHYLRMTEFGKKLFFQK